MSKLFKLPEEENKFQVVVIGAGGTGSLLLSNLFRYATFYQGDMSIMTIEADKVEEKNIQRQLFTHADIGENKATAVQKQFSDLQAAREMNVYNGYITDRDDYAVFNSIMELGSSEGKINILVDTTDNIETHLMLENAVKQTKFSTILLAAGNDEFDGQTIFATNKAFQDKGYKVNDPLDMIDNSQETKYPSDIYPDVFNEEQAELDQSPARISCAEHVNDDESNGIQAMIANVMSSTLLFNLITNITGHELTEPGEYTFRSKQTKMIKSED